MARRIKPKRAPRDLREALATVGPAPSYTDAHTVEQAAAVARSRVAWQQRRAQVVETHRKRSRLSDPGMVQERHSPTVEIAVDDPESKRKARRNLTRVRQSEAWRHNQLTPMQRQAETEMQRAWAERTVGLGAHSMKLDTNARGRSIELRAIEQLAYLDETWRDWSSDCRRLRLRVDVVLMIMTEPLTLAEIERAWRLRPGRAMAIYVRGLDLWATLRGWLRPLAVEQHEAART